MDNVGTKQNNLVKGLRLLRTSNILSIVSVIIAIAGGITAAVAMAAGIGKAMQNNNVIPSAEVGAVGIGTIVALIGMVISLIGGVIGIVALVKSSSSHTGYRNALIFVGIGMVLSAAIGLCPFITSVVPEGVLSALTTAVNFMVVFFVINATVLLLRNNGNQDVADRGDKVRKLYTISAAAIVICNIVMFIPIVNIIAGLVVVVASIMQIVALFKFIGFLGQSAVALESQTLKGVVNS